MKKLIGAFVVVSILLFSRAGLPVEPETWDPEKEIPQLVHIGRATPEEVELGKAFRNGLVANIRYWRDRGMPNPTDLDGLFHFTSYEDVRLVEIIQTLNPDIREVQNHIEAQYRALRNSELGYLISRFGKKLFPKKNIEEVFDSLFDQYASIRYGFTVPKFREAIAKNLTPAEARVSANEGDKDTFADNAFFGRFPRLDLAVALAPAQSSDPNRKIDWTDAKYLQEGILRVTELTQRSQNSGYYSRRIVILPRTLESQGADISTLRDQSVGDHELGHHLNHFLAGRNALHRLVDEVLADFLAAAPLDNPKIGAFFAKASGEVARRLEVVPEDKRTPDDLDAIFAFGRIAEKGLLRDLSEESDIDSVERFFDLPNDYDAGQPLRNFLWRLHERNDVDDKELEALVLKATPRFAALPKLQSRKADFLLMVRGIIAKLVFSAQTDKELKALRPKITDQVRTGARKVATDEIQKAIPTYQEELRKMPRDQQIAFLKKKIEKREKEILTAFEQKDDEKLKSVARRKAVETLEQKEGVARLKARNAHSGLFPTVRRPRVQADHIVPEYLRSLYRTAQETHPNLVDQIRSEAEATMNSSSMEISEGNGVSALVFVPSKLDRLNLLARVRLSILLRSLAEKRKDFERLSDLEPKTPDDEAKLRALKSRYAKELEHLSEFERTGSTFRLFFPHPVLATALFSGKLAMKGFVLAAKLLPTSKAKCAKTVASVKAK